MMYLGHDGPDRIRRHVATDPWARSVAAAVIERAEALHREPLIERIFEPGRNVMLTTCRSLAERIHFFGIVRFLNGDPRHSQRLLAELEAAAAFHDWNPVHFIDAAEMMAAVALGRNWLQASLTVGERRRLDMAILDLGLRPALDSLRSGVSWTKADNNWNIVCCAGPIIAACALRDHHRQLADEVIDLASRAIRNGLASYSPDGGWPEGPSYWEYATRYAVLAMAALEDVGLDALHLGASPRFVETWRFDEALMAPSGLSFNYGDNVLEHERSPVLGWLAMKSADPAAADWQGRSPGRLHPFDLVWCAPKPKNAIRDRQTSFAKAGISVLQDGDLYVALRGGSNATNHSHLDLGTFILEANGRRFVSDLGRDDYALPGYFRATHRFGYARIMTKTHNTIVFDGKNQSPSAVARNVEIVSRSGGPAAALAIDDPDGSCVSERAIVLLPGSGALIIDDIQPRPPGEAEIWVDWQVLTLARADLDDSEAKLTLDGASLLLLPISPPDAVFYQEAVPTVPGEADNSGFTRLYMRCRVPADGLRFAVLFLADSDRRDHALAAASGELDNRLDVRAKTRLTSHPDTSVISSSQPLPNGSVS